MEAIILAGGLGTRLRGTIGNDIPKCMAPVAGRPFLTYLFTYLSKFGVSRVVLSVGHLKEVIKNWCRDNQSDFPFEIVYAEENEPLGTGGGIRLALGKCKEPIVYVLNGDTYFDADLFQLGDSLADHEHRHQNAIIELALKNMTDFDRYGTVEIGEDSKIIKFNEKAPSKEGLINGGIYAISRERFLALDLPEKFSFEKDVLEPQCRLGSLYGIRQDGYFIDIGIPSDYDIAQEYFKHIQS